MGIELKEALKRVDIAEFYGSTNDGSTNILEGYGSDALLIKTALHVPVNSRGSRQRYIK